MANLCARLAVVGPMEKMKSDVRQNRLLALGLAAGIPLLIAFLTAAVNSNAGEIAGALGSLIGGIVGAGGAVWAVFLMLARQREEETAKVAAAVRTEVTTLVKYMIHSVEICQQIADGTRQVPRQAAQYIVKNLLSDPIIYPAIADRVGLLPYPQAVTEFYMRLSEAKAMVEALRTRIDPPEITYSSPSVEYVTSDLLLLLLTVLARRCRLRDQ
jgi:hypothetical protein